MTTQKTPIELGLARRHDADTYGVGDAFDAVYDAQELFLEGSDMHTVEDAQATYVMWHDDAEEIGAWPISGDDLALARKGVIA